MNAPKLPRRNPATAAVKPATFPAIANSQAPPAATTVVTPEEDSLVALAVRNATSAVRSDTLLATALRAVATAVVTVALAVASRPATPAVDTATWPVTAHRDRSATTVPLPLVRSSGISSSTNHIIGGEVGHVSRDCTTEANGERVCYKCKQPGHVQSACPN